jgi:hypothetical protein
LNYYNIDSTFVNKEWNVLYKIWNLLFLLDFFSIIFLSLVRVYLPLCFGYVVIAERFVVDTIADYTYVRYYVNLKPLFKKLIVQLIRLMPRCSQVICLHATYSTLLSRCKQRGSPVPHRTWVEHQLNVYKLIGIESLTTIKTDGISIGETFEEIKKLLSYQIR